MRAPVPFSLAGLVAGRCHAVTGLTDRALISCRRRVTVVGPADPVLAGEIDIRRGTV